MKNRMKKLVAIAATAAMVGSLPVSAVTTYAADDDIKCNVCRSGPCIRAGYSFC